MRRLPHILLCVTLGLCAVCAGQSSPTLFRRDGLVGGLARVRVDTKLLSELSTGKSRFDSGLFAPGAVFRITQIERAASHTTLFASLERERESRGSMTIVYDREHRVAAHTHAFGKTITVRHDVRSKSHVTQEHGQSGPDCGVREQLPHEPHKRAKANSPTSLGSALVDVIVPFTPLARSNAGGTAAMLNEVRLRIALANDANKQSGVTWRFRLVWTGETKYSEPDPVKLVPILRRLQANNDGYMDEIHKIRDRFGGDVVALICDGKNRDWGGYAYCRSSRATAFSITHREGLAAHLLHHEMGHNLGCAHNRANVDCRGSYSYSYGWRTHDNVLHTVMAYRAGKSQRINLWSSPKAIVLNYTMGTTTDDNARSLNNRGPIVAKFSATTVLEWCTLNGGIHGSQGLPELVGSGAINNAAPLRVQVERVPAKAPGLLVIGGRRIDLPIFGGTLVPALDVVAPVVGPVKYDASFLRLLPKGTDVWFQGFFLDAKATQGWSASDAITTRIP